MRNSWLRPKKAENGLAKKNFSKNKKNLKKRLTNEELSGIITIVVSDGRLAQLVEHLLDVQVVRGSSPLTSTI